jgi:lactate dehydrogenase-like 2-hydroxyacid dehydrogenase
MPNTNRKVLLTAGIHNDGIKLIEEEAEIVYPTKPLNLLTSRDLIETGRDCNGIIAVTNVEKISREVIEALPKLQIIARHGVGFENVDVTAASERGVYVTTTPVLDETVADHAFALLLSLSRNICIGHNYVASKQWTVSDPRMFVGQDVWGKTLGIIGLGRIGCKIARRAAGFAMRTLYFDVVRKPEQEKQLNVEYKPLNELLMQSDVMVISCALTEESRSLIGERELALMKRSAFLINIARGPIVQHDALVRVLRDRTIAGAGLDVFDQEPLPSDDPLIGLENVVMTPHLASNTAECRRRMAITVAEDVVSVIRGEAPKYPINPQISVTRH